MSALPFTHFRGWGEQAGKWVYGGDSLVLNISATIYNYDPQRVSGIHPFSLGMFTGVYDKYNNPIYGSINGSRGGDVYGTKALPYSVIWATEALQWWAKPDGDCGVPLWELLEPKYDHYRLLGNQWENGELMEVGKI